MTANELTYTAVTFTNLEGRTKTRYMFHSDVAGFVNELYPAERATVALALTK